MVGQWIYYGVLILCGILILLQILGQRMRGLTAILFRLTGGVVGIFCTNAICGLLGLAAVGLNWFTLTILGALGLPGAVLLYILLNIKY